MANTFEQNSKIMRRLYLILSVIGFVLPNIWVMKVTFETGNILFYGNPLATAKSGFANDISSAFLVDLLFMVVVFMIWSYHEAKKYAIKNVAIYWVATFLFGIAGAFPLFLYTRAAKFREDQLESDKD